MSSESTRRDFILGKSAAERVADLARGAELTDSPAGGPWQPAAAASYLINVSRRAMACEFQVFLNAGQYPGGTDAALEAMELLEPLEDQLSIFRESSELSRLNRTAAQGAVEVEPRLFDLLALAARLYAQTDGAFDITSTPLWKAWGFARRHGSVPSEQELAAARKNVGTHLVEFDTNRTTVRFRQAGVELNLGSIGKGYALDRCGENLAAAGVNDFLFHAGQSSVLARGSQMEIAGADETDGDTVAGWIVGVANPVRPRSRLAEIRLRDRALATSGSARQYFRHKGRRYGHVLDPRTGQPAEGVLSATAIAPSAAVADALSTAFYVMGVERSLEYCQSRAEVAAVLVFAAGSGGRLEVCSIGLSDDDLVILPQWK